MNTFSHLSPFLAVISGSLFSGTALCNDIVLPPPDKKGGKPLMQVLHERHSTRSFADKPIPVEVLSSLLWAAQGVNRDDPDYRTAPSSRNSNEIEIYVVLPQGSYLYKPETHRLEKVVQGDMRAATGTQEFAATAPLNLVYVVVLAHELCAEQPPQQAERGVGHAVGAALPRLGVVVEHAAADVVDDAVEVIRHNEAPRHLNVRAQDL